MREQTLLEFIIYNVARRQVIEECYSITKPGYQPRTIEAQHEIIMREAQKFTESTPTSSALKKLIESDRDIVIDNSFELQLLAEQHGTISPFAHYLKALKEADLSEYTIFPATTDFELVGKRGEKVLKLKSGMLDQIANRVVPKTRSVLENIDQNRRDGVYSSDDISSTISALLEKELGNG